MFVGLTSYADAVPKLFPWADLIVHEETYDAADYVRYESECVFVDNEGDRFVVQDYHEWADRWNESDLRPYTNGAGEVDLWRLELKLNELGKAFLFVDEFATRSQERD